MIPSSVPSGSPADPTPTTSFRTACLPSVAARRPEPCGAARRPTAEDRPDEDPGTEDPRLAPADGCVSDSRESRSFASSTTARSAPGTFALPFPDDSKLPRATFRSASSSELDVHFLSTGPPLVGCNGELRSHFTEEPLALWVSDVAEPRQPAQRTPPPCPACLQKTGRATDGAVVGVRAAASICTGRDTSCGLIQRLVSLRF